jgi:hypothetical protein
MDRYIIISGHTAEDCRQAVKHFAEFHAGYITHFEWGCKDNDHNAYAIIEADSHEQALLVVPPLFRSKAKVVKLVRFYPKKDGMDSVHKKE